MSSSVFFKFKSQKEPSRVTFDGTGISVFELKRAIIETNNLGDGTDFDLAIYNEDTNEEYDDDTAIIPRSTSIIARRKPPLKAGRGSAARYVSGKMPVNALNSSRMEKPVSKPAIPSKLPSVPTASTGANGAQSEEDKIAAMFQAGAEQWDQQQQEMANATPVFRSGAGKPKPPSGAVPAHPPPSGYICYRCGEKGHWIQECPTNDNPEFDNRPRVKRTTGIPRSFLKTIEKPASLSNDGLTDTAHQPSGVMVNAEGDFVVAEPDKASWDQFQAKNKVSAAAQEAAKTGSKDLQDRGLECSIDKRLFVEPTKTPCCGKTYCNDCITNALIENDLTCPGCQSEGILIDNLIPDEEMTGKVKSYADEKVKADVKRSESPKVKAEEVSSGKKSDGKSPSPSGRATPGSTGNAATPSSAPMEKTNSKKRPASGDLDDPRIPKGPAAMRKQQQQSQAPAFDPNNLSAMMGFPPTMPFNQLGAFGGDAFNGGMNPMGMPNGYMGMPMSMGPMMGMPPNMMNPMMMNGGLGANGGNYGGMGGMNFPQMPNGGSFNGGYGGAGMMPNGGGGFGAQQQMPMGNGGPPSAPNMNGGGQMVSNQAQTGFGNGPPTGQEDNAYFRQPVNPHRHQARQRRMRPSDYQEL